MYASSHTRWSPVIRKADAPSNVDPNLAASLSIHAKNTNKHFYYYAQSDARITKKAGKDFER